MMTVFAGEAKAKDAAAVMSTLREMKNNF